MSSRDPSDPWGDTRSFPEPPAAERPRGQPLPGYEPPFRPPEEPPRRDSAARAWMVAFFLLLFGVIAVVVLWLVVLRSEDKGGLEFSTTAIDFGDEDLGQRSAVQTVLLDNEGADPVRISSIAIEGENARDFQVTDETTCSSARPLEENATCTIGVRFRPRVREERSAVLVVRLSGVPAPVRIQLRGTGVGEATVVLDTSRLDLGRVLIGKSRTRRVTLTNAGNAPLQIQEFVLEGDGAADFRLGRATDCSIEERLPAGESCTIAITFTPKQGGSSTASLAILHDAEGSPAGVELRGEGRGQAELRLEPTEIDFGELELGGTAGPQTVTVANDGTASFVIARIELAGPAAADFSLADTSTCLEEAGLEPGESCTVDLVFSATAEGERSAALEVETRGGLASRVDLTGVAAAPPGATTE